MQLTVDDEILNLFDSINIFQTRTGMNRKIEPIKRRWKLGDTLNFTPLTKIEMYSTIASGHDLFSCGSFSSVVSSIGLMSEVGRYTIIASGCSRMGFRHPIEALSMNSAFFNFARENVHAYFLEYEKKHGAVNKKPVPTPQPQNQTLTIGNDVWIGNNVKLTGGITIGTGAVIASNSVVTKSIPPYAIVAGIPAVVKKFRFNDEIIEDLLKSQWWEYELGDMYKLNFDFSTPENFLIDFNEKYHKIRKHSPKIFYPLQYTLKKNNINITKNMIITHHGTVAFLDQNTGKINHKSNNYNNNDVVLGYIENNNIFFKLKDKYVCEIDLDGHIKTTSEKKSFAKIEYKNKKYTIKNNYGFLSARKNGEFGYINTDKEWEEFIIVSSEFDNSAL